jgi:hypothetical protein
MYDKARRGETVELSPRRISIYKFDIERSLEDRYFSLFLPFCDLLILIGRYESILKCLISCLNSLWRWYYFAYLQAKFDISSYLLERNIHSVPLCRLGESASEVCSIILAVEHFFIAYFPLCVTWPNWIKDQNTRGGVLAHRCRCTHYEKCIKMHFKMSKNLEKNHGYIWTLYVHTQSFMEKEKKLVYVKKIKICLVNSHIGALKIVFLHRPQKMFFFP